MAMVVVQTFTSDLSGSDKDVSTVTFGLNGITYEIDLTANEQDALNAALAQYIDAGRRVAKGASVSKPRSRQRGNADTQAIREWAQSQGIDVAERGRISANVRAKYEAAQGK